MYSNSKIVFLVIILIASLAIPALSASNYENRAFNYYGAGARAMGMGGAIAAVGGDISCGFWNPAGLASIKDSQISVSYNVFGKSTDTNTEWFSNNMYVSDFEFSGDINGIDYISLTLPLSQENIYMVHQVSFHQVYNFKYDGSFANPYFYESTLMEQIGNYTWDISGALQALSYSVGFQVWDWLQVGASYHHYVGGYDFTNNMELAVTTNTESYSEEIAYTGEWDFLGDNFTIGAIVKPWDFLAIAVVFKTNYDLKAQYSEEVDTVSTEGGTENTEFATTEGDSTIKYPSQLTVGASIVPMDNLTIAASYSYANWKADKNEDDDYIRGTISGYDEPHHPDAYPTTVDFNYPTFTDPDAYDQQAETYLRFGAEYIYETKTFDIALRAGYWIHRAISLDSNGNSIDFNGITGGIGITLDFLQFDFAWVNQSGSYAFFMEDGPNIDNSTNLFYAQISYIFESF